MWGLGTCGCYERSRGCHGDAARTGCFSHILERGLGQPGTVQPRLLGSRGRICALLIRPGSWGEEAVAVLVLARPLSTLGPRALLARAALGTCYLCMELEVTAAGDQ